MCVFMFYTMIVAFFNYQMWRSSLFSFRYHATYIFIFVSKNDTIYKSGGVLIKVLFFWQYLHHNKQLQTQNVFKAKQISLDKLDVWTRE